MKRFLLLSTFATLFLFASPVALGQTVPTYGKKDPAQKTQLVEISCGKCQFQLKSKDCSLAVRIKGKSYFVDGADIDAFGDAHANDGFCNAVSKAEVQGKVVKGRFKASYVKLVESKKV